MFGIGSAKDKQPSRTTRAALEGFVDVVAIEGQAVKLRSGEYVAMVEVEGEFINMMEEDEQDQRIIGLGRVLNGLPWPTQITVFVEPTDISGYLKQMEEVATQDELLAEFADAQMALAQELAGDVLAESAVITASGRNAEEATKRAQQMLGALRNNDFRAEVCTSDRIGQILMACYAQPQVALSSILGGFNALIRRPLPKDEAARGKGAHPAATGAEVSVAPVTEEVLGHNAPRLGDVIAPSALIEHPGYIDLGGTYASTLVAVAFPDQVSNGWLEDVVHFSHGSVRRRVSMHIEPVAPAHAIAELSRKLLDLQTNYGWSAKRGMRPDVNVELGLEDAEGLRQEIARGQVRIFDLTLSVTLMSHDLKELQEAVVQLKQAAAGFSLVLRETWLEEAVAFRSTMPLNQAIVRRVRPVPTTPLATTFPFTAGELLHEQGELWGINLSTGNAIIVDPRRYSPAHLLLVAQTRSGKSFVIKVLATQALFTADEDVMILDPSPAIDYERWARRIGGTYARFAVGSDARINPCEILLPADMKRIDDDMLRPVTAKVAFLKSIFGLMAYPKAEMPSEESALLEKPLFDMYAEFGLTDDWNSIVDTEALSALPKAKRSPTLRDAMRHIQLAPGLEGLAIKLRPFVEGTLDMFSGETNLDMGRRLTVFNVHGLTQGVHLQAVAYAMISEFVRWRLAMARRRAFVVVDEGHIMFQREDTARFVSQLYRMAGKQGGRVALATQGITDLLGNPDTGATVPGEAEARVVLTNTGITILLRNDKMPDLRLIQSTYGLTEAEVKLLRSSQPGQGIVVAGNDRAFVKVLATDALYPWITTRPEEVEMFREQGVYAAVESPVAVLDISAQ